MTKDVALAVLEKIGGLHVNGCDAYINVIGGLELEEPAADLALKSAGKDADKSSKKKDKKSKKSKKKK